jgi:carbon-monoxide dehydrogenase small subunit
MSATIDFFLNGNPVHVTTDPDRYLLWVLRTDLALTGAKYGCGLGTCGACTVLIENQAVRSCMVRLNEVAGKHVTTIEGLASADQLHPLQDAFVRHSALQCGFCTPGMILNAYGLLTRNPRATEQDIIAEMDGNLCRCGSHPRIVRAILDAADQMKGGTQ